MSHSEAERARSLRKPDWARHKATIEDLYLKQKNTLKGVIKAMEARGFKASEQQYKIKLAEWGFSKYKKGRDTRNGRGNSSRGQAEETIAAPGHAEGTTAAFRGQPDYMPRPDPDMNMFAANPGLNSQSLWNGNLGGTLSGTLSRNEDVDIINNYGSYNVLGLNPGISQSQRVSTPPRSIPTTTTTRGLQPIHLAANSGNLAMMKLLLETYPSCAGIACMDGATAIWLAAARGHFDIVQLLLTYKDVDVNCKDEKEFCTPLHQAAQGGHTEIVRVLLSHGALVDPVHDDGITPMWCAAQQGHHEIVQLLINAGANKEATSTDGARRPIHQASQNGHLEVVRILLDANSVLGALADPVGDDGVTPLWCAAQQGHHEIVQLLIDAGANKEATSTDGARRPIHQASQSGHLEVVRILIDAGAMIDPDMDSFSDETPSPLWLAAQQGNCEIARLLIRQGANVNFSLDPSKRFPIHQAAQNGYLEMVGILVQSKADINAREVDGWPPLMVAAQNNYAEIVDLLLQKGADVNAEEKDGATALWMASQQGHAQVIKKLLEHGAKSLPTRSSQRLPIQQAAQNGHLEAVMILLELSPQDVNAEDENGCTPLFLASHGETEGHLEVARHLIEKGAKVVR